MFNLEETGCKVHDSRTNFSWKDFKRDVKDICLLFILKSECTFSVIERSCNVCPDLWRDSSTFCFGVELLFCSGFTVGEPIDQATLVHFDPHQDGNGAFWFSFERFPAPRNCAFVDFGYLSTCSYGNICDQLFKTPT